MKDYYFISECDGGLYDTRKAHWSKKPLRETYSRSFGRIENTQQLKATLRAGQWAWPGGYPMYFYTNDGAAICFDCAREELRNILDSINTKTNDGWMIIGTDTNYENPDLYCDHCNKHIQSAYGEEIDDGEKNNVYDDEEYY